MGNDLERSDRALFEVLAVSFLEGLLRMFANTIGQNNRCFCRDLIRAPPEYESGALPLRQPGR
jgi:hypothetical protein